MVINKSTEYCQFDSGLEQEYCLQALSHTGYVSVSTHTSYTPEYQDKAPFSSLQSLHQWKNRTFVPGLVTAALRCTTLIRFCCLFLFKCCPDSTPGRDWGLTAQSRHLHSEETHHTQLKMTSTQNLAPLSAQAFAGWSSSCLLLPWGLSQAETGRSVGRQLNINKKKKKG